MDAGKFDRRVLIESKTETQSALGDLEVTWSTVATVWARKLSSKGREFYAGAQTLGAQEVGIQIRHTPTVADLNQIARFTLEGKVYNIKSIDEVGRREYQTIIGTFGANDG
jgi:SPP1 family predicted phage head-tail adaptor